MELRAYPEHFVNDSIVLRQFCRLYLEGAPDDTTLIRWANQIGSETVAALNERTVELARSLKVTRGRKLRVDAMVVETNIHHPTDSALLGDGVRVISRLLRRAKKVLPTEVGGQLGKEAFRTRNRSVRRTAQRLHRIARKKGEKAKKELKEAYQKLITITQASCAQARRVVEAFCEETPILGPNACWSGLGAFYRWSSRGSHPGSPPRPLWRAGSGHREDPEPL
jgi:IS5 family transposase